jgi:pyrimidine dimer DNA glycosylase
MTFYLPYPDFYRSAKCLTDEHLMEQRNFCRNAIQAIAVPGSTLRPRPVNVVIWDNHINALLRLCDATLRERRRRKADERGTTPWMLWKRDQPAPMFIGDKEFHDEHKRNLMHLSPSHYGRMGWTVGS